MLEIFLEVRKWFNPSVSFHIRERITKRFTSRLTIGFYEICTYNVFSKWKLILHLSAFSFFQLWNKSWQILIYFLYFAKKNEDLTSYFCIYYDRQSLKQVDIYQIKILFSKVPFKNPKSEQRYPFFFFENS